MALKSRTEKPGEYGYGVAGKQSELILEPKCPLAWRRATSSNFPPFAVIAGKESDGRPLYVARAFHDKWEQLGKAGLSCGIGYGCKEHILSEFEVLCADPDAIEWIPMRGIFKMPTDCVPIPAGTEKHAPHKRLVIARIMVKNNWIPGKTGEHLSIGASCAANGTEYESMDYEILCFRRV
ncbi:hypothetical protein BC833DRAFT_621809 [Globomyces pollinis-pini]|nr:hypothetical protein BC833DRAFT_621809 [Globomyces pollinis-pini]